MSFNDDYLKLRKKRLEEQQKQQKNAPFVFESGPYQNATLTADDIAPVKSQNTVVIDDARDIGKKNTGSGLFKAGTFADGYQFGDITKAKLGTVADVVLGIVQGVAGIGEGLGDLAMYGVAGVQDLVGNDDDAERLRKATQEDIIAPLFDSLRKKTNIDDTSLLGDFGYGIAQGVGQVGAIIATGGAGSAAGLGTVGTSALTTGMIGASSMGSGMSEAYKSGATDEEALAYGAMSGVIDAGTEMIFGGLGKSVKAIGVSKGISSLDDVFAKKISSKISNQFFQNAAEYGIKAGAEGLEEVLAGLGSAAAKKLTYMSEEELSQLVEDENLLEQFVAGTIVSGIAQSGDLVKSTKQGRDFITNFSGNEETVIEKVYNDRVAEAEQDGTKLTNKEKNKLYEQVQEDMRKGYISTDDIESVLGGETYKSYKDTVDSEDAILKEFDELGKKQNATLAEQSRYAELQEKVKEIKSNSNRNNLKSQLSEEVYNSVKEKDFYLAESYNEKARRGTAFEADLSHYDDKTAETVKRAIDSGILNNTRRTHEFVDMVAKISADKGVLFDFTNNEKLKESGFAVGGASINGYVTKDGITVNISSSKATNSIVGHEITHVLEGTELYAEMQKTLFEYSKSKNDYDSRRKALEELYKNVKGADIDAELTADLVGDYLFTDADFINNLSTKHRNVFQKIYDEIKYLFKIATKGSKEARELEKVKKAFDKAYRANGKASGDMKYSLSDSDGKKLTKEQSEYFKDSKMRDENGNLKVMYHGSQDAGFHVFDANMSDDDTSLFFVDRNDVAASYSGTSETYEAQTIRTAEDMNNFIESIGVEGYEVVEKDGKFTLLYEGDRIADSNTAKGIYEEFCWYEGVGEGDANYKVYLNLTNPLEVDAEGRNWNNISREFSQEVYGRYKSLTAEEKAALSNLAEWGEYSIFRDEMLEARATAEQGGSGVFDEAYTKNLARAYAKLGGANANLYDAFSIAQENFSEESLKEFAVKQMNTRDYARKAKAEGYDGVIFKNIHDNGGYSNGSEGASTVAIAFESNQIKSVANEKPTGNADIRYSLSENSNVDSTEYKINTSMTMAEAKRMIETAYKVNRIAEYYEGEYLNAEDWLKKAGADEVEMYIENDYDLQAKYINSNEDILNEEYSISDVLNAYLKGSLIGKAKPKPTRLDVSQSTRLKDDRFYSPQKIENAKALFELANQKAVGKDKNAITRARAEILLFAHNKGAAELLGVTQAELNKKLRSWSNYSATAKNISERINAGVAEENRWTGIENSSYINKARVTNEDIERLVASVEGESKGYQRQYIARVMLAADTHIDYSKLKFKFATQQQVNADNNSGGRVLGFYRDDSRTIEVTHDKPNTVAHEMGHYLDAQWGRDLLGTDNSFLWLTNGVNEDIVRERHGEQGVQFLKNFKLFINSLSDVNTTYNAYYNDRKEIFARFFARFVEWTNNIATGNKYYSYESTMYGDQFTQAQFVEFARLLQEKALLDGNVQTANKFSLSDVNETPKRYGNYNIFGEDIRLEAPTQEEVAPIQEEVAPESEVVAKNAIPTEDVAPMLNEPTIYDLEQKQAELEDTIRKAMESNDPNAPKLIDEYGELLDTIAKRKKEESAMESERLASLDDADVPSEMEAPYYGESTDTTPENLFEERDIKAVGNRQVKAYMYENPEVKPFFQEEANRLLKELRDGTNGERWFNDQLYYDSGGEYGFSGTKRHVSADIAYLLDNLNFSYADIEKGINAIIEDNGKENNAASKRIEFILNDRLLKGYTDFTFGYDVPPNQDYINLLNEKQIIEYSDEARAKFFEVADEYAPPVEDIAPVAENTTVNEPKIDKPIEDIAPTFNTKKKGEIEGQQTMFEEEEAESEPPKVATILTEEPEVPKKKNRAFTQARTNLLDKGSVFEDLSLKTGNRELQGKYNFMHYSEARAQKHIADNLKPLVKKAEQLGKSEQLYEYVYHLHNIDRMSLETEENRVKREALREKFKGYSDKQIERIAMEWIKHDTPKDVVERIKAAREYIEASKGKNKPVFGDTVTADVSRDVVRKLEAENPEFKELSKEIIEYNAHLRQMLVDAGVISQETADLWAKMYPHYVPIRRLGDEGLSVNVPLDTNKTGVNAPIKRATGGNRDIMPLFDTMAMRTEQTFKAIAKNNFGTELMHTLDSTVESNATSLDDVIDSFDNHEELLQEGKNGKNPTFTVFENGKRVTFEITEDMYDALKPTSKGLSYTNKVANTASNIFRGILTEYNPVFMVSNAAKDIQDVLINSQHAAKTYANIPRALKELTTKGKWHAEYMANGGEQNTYFDSESKTFKEENKGFIKTIGMPLRAISTANNFIERIPRLAEYIASREAGASVEVAMLDAARVTTNFAAGGDVTKFLNRNGATFLNASVQGFNQNVRNVREAKANGLKGWVKLTAKVALAGVPALLLNNLLWDDDEEYEELSEYVKDKYYIVAKTEDGKFIRIPKGRVAAVIQDAFEQINNAVTGNDEVDFKNFFNLVISNLAPNNPIENNILAPIIQVANNKTWYGEDLVPTRLQDLPAGEQYDESTDAFSKWLGEKTNISPYKLNYLLNQYSGGVGDVFLPMLTPEAESGDNSFKGNILAPMKDKFTTDSTLNNKNVSAFYDTMDELTTNAKSSKATDEDILKYKYFNSINAELSELYAQKREIQNSDLANDEKYEAVRELQEQINDLARESLNTYENVYISDGYASIGDIHYRWYEPGEDSDAEAGWQKITDKQLEKQEAVTSYLGVEPSEYWKNKTEYDFAYEYPEKYSVAKSVGGYSAYKRYTSELYDIKADKDEDGKSISGSRKEKVIEYVNNLDIDYGARLILFKSEYNADDTYNYDIIDYLNNRQDISYEEMETILKELGFTVRSDGTIQWD